MFSLQLEVLARISRNDFVAAQVREETGEHVFGVSAVVEPGPTRFNRARDVIKFHQAQDGISERASQISFLSAIYTVRTNCISGVPPRALPKAISSVGRNVRPTLRCTRSVIDSGKYLHSVRPYLRFQPIHRFL